MDPEAVDPEILAEQIALAERAAVLNRRAMARQKLAEQAGGAAAPGDNQAVDAPSTPGQPKAAHFGIATPKPASPAGSEPKANQPKANPPKDRPGPSTTNNLAMVTPLEFVQVPGVDRPVMKPPATSHVPVTTRPGTRVPAAGRRQKRSRPAGPAARLSRCPAARRSLHGPKRQPRPPPGPSLLSSRTAGDIRRRSAGSRQLGLRAGTVGCSHRRPGPREAQPHPAVLHPGLRRRGPGVRRRPNHQRHDPLTRRTLFFHQRGVP